MASVSRCKAIVLGDKAVGKTSILNCLLGYPVPFSKRYNTTKGVNIVSKSIKLIEPREDCCLVDIYFYDFSGRSVYTDLVRSLWANNVSLVIGVFDVTREESFYHLQTVLSDYMKQFGKQLNENNNQSTTSTTNTTTTNSFAPLCVVGVILGNKVDLTEQRSVDEEESSQWAKHIRMRYFDVSAKDNIGIEESFNHLVRSWSDSNRTN
ncbi:ras-related protein Rab-7b-like [Panonychus citri]|uniref:ras-related protein Rab-7b-like n=1 Tax=Panonychus citri TaxID=50023 RepID=UPI002307E3C2|nr:ras-related protein Rab-7b-like [Panonychus citri]